MFSRRTAPLLLAILVIVPAAAAQDGQLWVGPNVNMVSGTTWPDGDPFLQRQNEPSVAGSTRDSMTLMGFVNDYRSVDIPGLPEGKETGDSWLGVFKSFDGGLTWRSTLLPGYPQDLSPEGLASPIGRDFGAYEAAADPVVRAGTHGLFYLSGIVFDRGDPARSAVFVSRYMDLDNREGGDPIEYIDTTRVRWNDVGDEFIDKPWMAVDVPRGAPNHTVWVPQDGNLVQQDIQCGNVYLAWVEISGVLPNRRSAVMFTRSEDCGETWDIPTEVSDPDTLNQGVTVAVSPSTGDVWVAWRRFDTNQATSTCAFGWGYWRTHPEEWPVESITMGGLIYTKAEALVTLKTSKGRDATYILAKQLIPAKLNAASGIVDTGLQDAIDAADAWLIAYPLGSKPKGAAKDDGLAIKDVLEAYNEGLLVAEGCAQTAPPGGSTGNAIVAVHSNGYGGTGTFTTPTTVSTLYPFEQGTSPISFRTNAYPSITAGTSDSEPDRAYLAWTTRGEAWPRNDPIEGDGRIVVSTSTDGVVWTTPNPIPVDRPEVRGHQLQPSITFAGGKVMLVYYDLRRDYSGYFDRFIADWPSMGSYRHTVDVRAAQAVPGAIPEFTENTPVGDPTRPSDQVSRYAFIPGDGGIVELLQFQFNPPNLPIFVDGTRPFFGDYIDLAASAPFLPDGYGGWRFNTEPEDGVVYHAAWTDNRDVEAPHDGNWENYVVPGPGGQSVFDPNQTVPACDQVQGGEGQTRIRDQNTYTARISRGLFVASPGSSRATDTIQRAFVVLVQNDTQEGRAFCLDIPDQSGVNASFEQFSMLTDLEIEIPGFSSASRTVFVDSQLERPIVRVNVAEIDGLGGSTTSGGLSSSILLNPDPTSPPPADDGLEHGEVYNLAMMNPAVENLAMMNLAMMNLAMMNLAMMNPATMNLAMMNLAMMNLAMMNEAMTNLAMMNPAMLNPAMMNQAVYSLAMMNPAMMNPAMINLAMMNPAEMNLAMMNLAMMNASLTDLTWEVRHEGNAAAAYSVNMVMDEPPGGFVYELLIYRLYTTPVADGCDLVEEAQHQMLVHVIDPDLLTGELLNPGTTDSDIGNATFWMEPGDEVYVTLRVLDPDATEGDPFDPSDLSTAVVAQAVNTEDALAGSTQPPYSIPDISVPTLATMNDGRVQHTTTLLPDGKVLVTGGFNPVEIESSAEIYDPATGQFTATGSMNAARAWHTATLLSSGEVLIFGGETSGPTAEIYDPITGTFTAAPYSLTGRVGGHRATLLADGRVLITGGMLASPIAVALTYDPSLLPLSRFTEVGSMGSRRWEHTATLLTDGTVLVTGGADTLPLSSTDTAEFFDPLTNSFTPVANTMSDARRFHSGTLLPNGKVLIAGGILDGGLISTDTADIYDPATDLFTPAAVMSDVHAAHIAEVLPNGKVLIAGGSDAPGGIGRLISTVELYEWSTDTFGFAGHLAEARAEHEATRLLDGDILITGGTTPGPPVINGTDTFEIYHPGLPPKFLRTGRLNEGRNYHTVTSLPGGDVLVVGGADGDLNDVLSIERYSPGSGTFTTVATLSPGPGRQFHSATLLHDGTVLIAGGYDDSGGTILTTALTYNPSDNSLTATSDNLDFMRYGHTATLLQDGRVLVVGGRGNTGVGYEVSAEIYDPADGTFSPAGTLVFARYSHTATLLNDGRVLIAGGYGAGGPTDTYEIWDSGVFGDEGVMRDARDMTRASLLLDGTVLIVGGSDGSDWLETAEIFDPILNSFSYTVGNMKLGRRSHGLIRLPSGEVLIVGGTVAGPALLSEAEIYDPITRTFSLTDVLNVAQSSPRATLLPDGKALIVGGWQTYGPFSGIYVPSETAEIFEPLLNIKTPWTSQFGTLGLDRARGVSTHTSGVYVAGLAAGWFAGQTNFGGDDAYVRRNDYSGNEVWTRQFGSAARDWATDVVVNDSGVYVAGHTSGALPDQTNSGGEDAFVRMYDLDGNEVWTRQFGTTAEDGDFVYGIDLDASGVYVVGSTAGTLPDQTKPGGIDAFVRKYDFSGNEVWTRQFGSTEDDIARGISVDDSGVFVAGDTLGSLPDQTLSGVEDAFVRMYDLDGNEVWTQQFGTNGYDRAYAVSVDVSGVYVAGRTWGAFTGQTHLGSYDAFVRKYDSGGAEVWTHQFGTTGGDTVFGIAVDASGVYLAGSTSGAFPGQIYLGNTDVFARRYDLAGNEDWTRQFGTDSTDAVSALSLETTGVYVVGSTYGSLPGETRVGLYDSFVVRFLKW